MKKTQIGAQLYSFREFFGSMEGVVDTLKKVKAIGYDNVQVSPAVGPIPEKELRAMLDDAGLKAISTSKGGVNAVEHTDAVIEHMKLLGCDRTVYNPPKLDNEKAVRELAAKLEEAALKMKAEGLTLAFHNHAHEFVRFGNRTMLDIIYEDTSCMEAEIDTYWVQAGGGNPVSWVSRMSGRMGQMHLKDFAVTYGGSHMAPVGEGNLDWNAIINAAEEGGVKYFVVEHDGSCPDPFASFKSSFDFLTRNFVR